MQCDYLDIFAVQEFQQIAISITVKMGMSIRIETVGSPYLPWPRGLPAFSLFPPRFGIFRMVPCLIYETVFKHISRSDVKSTKQ